MIKRQMPTKSSNDNSSNHKLSRSAWQTKILTSRCEEIFALLKIQNVMLSNVPMKDIFIAITWYVLRNHLHTILQVHVALLLLYERSWHEAADMIFTKSFTIRGEASNLPILTKALYVNLYTKAIQI